MESGKVTLDVATDLAVCIFNDSLSILKIMKVLGVTIDPNCYNFCVESDELRIAQIERSLTDAAKEHKIQQKREIRRKSCLLEGQLYGAGRKLIRLMIKAD